MGIVADLKAFIYEQEVKYRSSVSESTWYKIAGAINFILNRNHQEKQFFANGPYSISAFPQDFVDGITPFNFDAEIINVFVYNLTPGTSGSTKIDILKKPQIGGAWTSLFTTKPEIQYNAGTAWVGKGDTVPNCIAPVFAQYPYLVNKGDALKMQLLTGQTNGQNAGAIVMYRPR